MTLLPLPGCDDLDWSIEPAGDPGGPLLVVLGGMPEQPGTLPSFEGAGLCRRLGVRGLLLRDSRESWFLRGVRGLAEDLPALADAVRDQAAGASRVVLFGNSAGGYAALALGALLEPDAVVAVVPRSALTDDVNDALGDRRLAAQRRALLSHARAGEERYLDLPSLLTASFSERVARLGGRPAYRTRYRVLHATDNAQDAAHAARLAGLPELAVTGYPRGDHQLAAVLRAAGELDAVVAGALQAPLPAGVHVPVQPVVAQEGAALLA